MLDKLNHDLLSLVLSCCDQKTALHVLQKMLSLGNKVLYEKCSNNHVYSTVLRKKKKASDIKLACRLGYTQVLKLIERKSSKLLQIRSDCLYEAVNNGRLGCARYLESSRNLVILPSWKINYILSRNIKSTLLCSYLDVNISKLAMIELATRDGRLFSYTYTNVNQTVLCDWTLPLICFAGQIACLESYLENKGVSHFPLQECYDLASLNNQEGMIKHLLLSFTLPNVTNLRNIIIYGRCNAQITLLVFSQCVNAMQDGISRIHLILQLLNTTLIYDRLTYFTMLVNMLPVGYLDSSHIDTAIMHRSWSCVESLSRGHKVHASGNVIPINWKYEQEQMMDIINFVSLELPWDNDEVLFKLAMKGGYYENLLKKIIRSSRYSTKSFDYYRSDPQYWSYLMNFIQRRL